MRPETIANLADAKAAALEIQEIGGGTLQTSRIQALAIERLFEILGESLSRVREIEPEVLALITDAHAIIGLRNVIAHGYDAIDPIRIQSTITDRIPMLIDELAPLVDGNVPKR